MAVADYFLKLDGIQGESQDKGHTNEIALHSWSLGATNRGSAGMGGGMGSGKVDMGDVTFTKQVDKSGPKLFNYCCTGTPIPKAVFVARKAGKDQQEYLKITLSDSIVSSYNLGGSGGSDVHATEQFTLNFSKIEISYQEQKADGSLGGKVQTNWSTKTNTGA